MKCTFKLKRKKSRSSSYSRERILLESSLCDRWLRFTFNATGDSNSGQRELQSTIYTDIKELLVKHGYEIKKESIH